MMPCFPISKGEDNLTRLINRYRNKAFNFLISRRFISQDSSLCNQINTRNFASNASLKINGTIKSFLLTTLLLILFALNLLGEDPQKKEFRGVWIATINNIDWPSAPGLSLETQKKELTELVDRVAKLNLNVVIFQVRAAADAFYQSETEPWSYFLTGKQGLPPTTDFDPLSYAIELCHARGMELHAWFNPFRVRNNGYYKLDPTSFTAKHPQYLHEYDHKLFLDPGIPQVRSHLNKVVMEVVRKYNIDAIHFDDYFYPYPIASLNYPDLKTFRQFGKEYYPRRLGDWRRNNIDQFIKNLHDSIKAIKPQVKFGISPFGVWRNKKDDPNGSPGIKGSSSYDELYADVYKWLSNNWIDYVIPQLYWEQGNRFGDFTSLVKWWSEHSFGKQLYIGQALYKSTGAENSFVNPKEITQQITILRTFQNVGGFALYSASHLIKLSELALNDLTNDLLPAETVLNPISNPIITALQLNQNQHDEILLADRRSVADSINRRYQLFINSNLPVPAQFAVIKSHEGWTLSWNDNRSSKNRDYKFRIIIFEPIRGGGYMKRVLATTDSTEFFISRKSISRSNRVLFSIVSIEPSGLQSSFSKLFRIRGKRVRIN
jgi:uncharacterized lipoprotein YddW (UPF0748 family)